LRPSSAVRCPAARPAPRAPRCSSAAHREYDAIPSEPFGRVIRRWQHTPSISTPPPGTVVPFRTVAPDSAVGKRIGLVAPTSSDPFAKAVTDSVVAQVTAAGAKLIRCDPGDDATLVLDSLTGWPPSTSTAGSCGIPGGFLVGAELGRTSRIRSACAHDAFVIVTNSAADVVSADRIKGIRAGFTTQCPKPMTDEQLLDAGTRLPR